jgi:hypothetical protein
MLKERHPGRGVPQAATLVGLIGASPGKTSLASPAWRTAPHTLSAGCSGRLSITLSMIPNSLAISAVKK